MSNNINTLILKKISKAYYGFESVLSTIYLIENETRVKEALVELNVFLKNASLNKYIEVSYIKENTILLYTVKYKNNIDPNLVLGYITLSGVLNDF